MQMELFVIITLQRNGVNGSPVQTSWGGTVSVRPGATRAQVYDFVTHDASILPEEFRSGAYWVLFYSAEPLHFGGAAAPELPAPVGASA
jgi:hypothetical protein